MPPLPAWFDGRPDVLRFFAELVLVTPWRLVPVAANGQLGFACYQRSDGPFRLGAINLLTVRGGAVAEITGFLEPAVHRRFGLPQISPGNRRGLPGPVSAFMSRARDAWLQTKEPGACAN